MNEPSSADSQPQKLSHRKQSESKTSKGRRSNVQILKEEITTLKKELEETRDRSMRQAAEFDNFRKRKQRESMEWIQSTRENLVRELLPVVDDLDRFFQNNDTKDDVQWKGVQLIHEKLLSVLKSQGLTLMEALGKPFDPDYHDALLTVARDDVNPGTVVEVHENGYLMNDRVLRHAKVIVSKELEPDSDDKETANKSQK